MHENISQSGGVVEPTILAAAILDLTKQNDVFN